MEYGGSDPGITVVFLHCKTTTREAAEAMGRASSPSPQSYDAIQMHSLCPLHSEGQEQSPIHPP